MADLFFIVLWLAGLVLGLIIGMAIKTPKKLGILRVIHWESGEDPYLFLELSERPKKFKDGQTVSLTVSVGTEIDPQK